MIQMDSVIQQPKYIEYLINLVYKSKYMSYFNLSFVYYHVLIYAIFESLNIKENAIKRQQDKDGKKCYMKKLAREPE